MDELAQFPFKPSRSLSYAFRWIALSSIKSLTMVIFVFSCSVSCEARDPPLSR